MPRPDPRRLGLLAVVAVPSLAGATLVVATLEAQAGIPNASAVYIVAVVATAVAAGTAGAIVTAIGAFGLYNFLFTEPRLTLIVADPGAWLSVVLLLFVAVVVGQLVAVQRLRTEVALAREREALALFRISRALATRSSTLAGLAEISSILQAESAMARVWIALGVDAAERVAADTGDDSPPVAGLASVLRRTPGDEPAGWIRVHRSVDRARSAPGIESFRVRIEAAGAQLGSVWTVRPRRRSPPDRTATRLLAAAADQIGQVLVQDRLAAEARAAEIARQSDELKSALLQSVSHDLRTPLASIRAAVGTLRPDTGLTAADRQASADVIEREVEYLNRLVANLLDLSRIDAGALRAETEAFELADIVEPAIERLWPRFERRPIETSLEARPVWADPVLFDAAITNVLENAIRHTPDGTPVRIIVHELEPDRVRVSIEDAGPGVPEDDLERLFERFYQVPRPTRRSRSGTGIGLAVTRGLIEAMGGQASARPAAGGGLAIDLDLIAAPPPSADDAGPALAGRTALP